MGVTQINRSGFDDVNVSDTGQEFTMTSEGIDLYIVGALNGQTYTTRSILSEASVVDISEAEFEKDNITIDLSLSSFSTDDISNFFFLLDSLVSGDYEGREIFISENSLPEADSGDNNGKLAMDSLLMKNFTIKEKFPGGNFSFEVHDSNHDVFHI